QIGRGFNVGGGYFGAFGGVLGGGPVPLPDGKITSASQAAIAQISWFPTPKTYTFGTALTYVKSTAPSFSAYGLSGYTGSMYSDQPFGTFTRRRQMASHPNWLSLLSALTEITFRWDLAGTCSKMSISRAMLAMCVQQHSTQAPLLA
ncbi:MAG: hypothetical protein ACK5W5_04410, partial [Cyanobacteriota bacterium]